MIPVGCQDTHDALHIYIFLGIFQKPCRVKLWPLLFSCQLRHSAVDRLQCSTKEFSSLRNERFQSRFCAKVGAGALPSPSPFILFFCSLPNFLDELPRNRLLRRLGVLRVTFVTVINTDYLV